MSYIIMFTFLNIVQDLKEEGDWFVVADDYHKLKVEQVIHRM